MNKNKRASGRRVSIMSECSAAYLAAAASARNLLADPAVAAAWPTPSALREFSVSGLAAHLALQILSVPTVVAAREPEHDQIPLLDHYERVTWRGAGPSSEVNTAIRVNADTVAAAGVDALLERVDAAIDELRSTLPDEDGARPVPVPSWPWSLRLDDYLITRMMEIGVHSDDLAVSVGIATPDLPDAVLQPVISLLSNLAVRRHGQVAVLRALSRAERAPAAINAI
jgi:hypothetical protein